MRLRPRPTRREQKTVRQPIKGEIKGGLFYVFAIPISAKVELGSAQPQLV